MFARPCTRGTPHCRDRTRSRRSDARRAREHRTRARRRARRGRPPRRTRRRRSCRAHSPPTGTPSGPRLARPDPRQGRRSRLGGPPALKWTARNADVASEAAAPQPSGVCAREADVRRHALETRRRHTHPDPSPDASECLAAAILESGSFALVAIDLSRRIVRWNRAAEQLYEWRASEAIGRPIDLIVPEDRRDEFGAFFAALQRGEKVTQIDTVRVTKTGTTVQVHAWMSAVLDANGNLVGASLLTFDNSEQVATRAALVASEARYRALVDTLS